MHRTREENEDLAELARESMIEHGLEPDFPPAAMRQVEQLGEPHAQAVEGIKDLRSLAWCSIDNDESRDLDQLTVAEALGKEETRVLVAIADVDSLIRRDSPVDGHAERNTTSVYTPARIFPMLPERLSTDLTSLNAHEDRLAIVIEYVVLPDGTLGDSAIYRALVRNQAKLAYNSVAAWLEGEGPMPPAVKAVDGLDEQLRMQNDAAQRLRELRHEHGALGLETLEPRAVMADGRVVELQHERKNCARELIEDFMIAANGVTARFLRKRGFPTLRRVVRSPERWDRLERLAAGHGFTLPTDPDSKALARFLQQERRRDPLRFPDLSLQVIKLLGAGEYVAERPGEEGLGHFGLAVRDYSHSTAPNRRFPDLITQRLLKAIFAKKPVPYGPAELDDLATHCTEQEDAANRVERQMRKSAAAMLLSDHIGEKFDALVTGDSQKGTWVRVLHPPVEGKLMQGARGVDVADRIRVELLSVDIKRGFIDFARVG